MNKKQRIIIQGKDMTDEFWELLDQYNQSRKKPASPQPFLRMLEGNQSNGWGREWRRRVFGGEDPDPNDV
ncbi:MAG: hypothetical protein ACPGWR_06200 [Ardenticatenaceae bacterium]